MKDIFTRVSKRALMGITAFVVAGASMTGVAMAWGPDRPTYTIQQPADHVTFNSITNNPNYGDERTFFDVKPDTNNNQGGFVDKINVQDGQVLYLRVYVHNNAADNLNDPNFTGPGVAHNTKVRVYLPTATAKDLRANAYISASNAAPQEVYDTVDFTSTGFFGLEYVPGSAIAYNNAVPAGMQLSDSIVTSGAPIGYNQPDGNVPGCFQYVNLVTLKVKVKMPRYTVQKDVRMEGQTANDWKDSITAKAAQTTEWRIGFKNTGATTLNNVKIVDDVPAGLTVVPGSVRLVNASNPNGYTFPANAVQANGRQINVGIGDYTPGSNAYIYFKTKIADEKDLKCGDNKFLNNAFATPEGYGAVNDTASVVTSKTCATTTPPPTQLVKTGPGDVAGIFAATTVAGALVHRYVLSRRFLS
jgi:uncharacterized repeat protein (TIGR01451 family)